MKPSDIFGILVRGYGLMIAVYGIYNLTWGVFEAVGLLAEQTEGEKTAFTIAGGFWLVCGMVLLQWADIFVAIAYPRKKPNEE